ncbi:MAG: ParB N-terminal domain-containing protein [Sciscionella sp.]
MTTPRVEHQTLDQCPIVTVPIDLLLPADSPRLCGEDVEHIHVLAQSEAQFPPILVNRSTMRVIDGMHRLRAVLLRAGSQIDVQFFDGDEKDAFVLGVRANVAHGLPLSLADRKTAAARVIRSHPQWSDRAIARTVGLSHKTVSVLRRCPTGEIPHLDHRVGCDGRARPTSIAEARKVAGELMADNPDASLREVAKIAGISPETARDVRFRLDRGGKATPPHQRGVDQRKVTRPVPQPGSQADKRPAVTDRAVIVQNLKKDPSLRFSEAGRVLLRLLDANTLNEQEWQRLVDNVPTHCADLIAAAARQCSGAWQKFADFVEHSRSSTTGSAYPQRST